MSQKVRELTATEKVAIQKGLNQTMSPFITDFSTPLPKLLVSPLKNTLLVIFIQLCILAVVMKVTKTGVKDILKVLSIKGAMNSPLLALFTLFFFIYPVINYFNKVAKNNNIIESMKRLPEGATKMDYVSQTAIMSERLGRRSGSGFGSGFLGGFAAGSMRRGFGRRRR